MPPKHRSFIFLHSPQNGICWDGTGTQSAPKVLDAANHKPIKGILHDALLWSKSKPKFLVTMDALGYTAQFPESRLYDKAVHIRNHADGLIRSEQTNHKRSAKEGMQFMHGGCIKLSRSLEN